MMPHTVTVVIPNLHSPLIDTVVAALDQQTIHGAISDIIVVGQDSYGRVPAHVRFVATPQPICAAAARNLGAREACGEYILFLDADCVAAPDLLEHLLARHAEGHHVVGGSVVLAPDRYWVMCDNLLSFTPFLSTALPGPRRYVPSLNMSMTRTLFNDLGGFNPSFPGAAGEDIDLSLRVCEKGYMLYFEPRARVYHRPQRVSAQSVWIHLRNFGRAHSQVQRMHAGRAAPRLSMRTHPWTASTLAVAPLLAVWDALNIYRANPALQQHWRLLPGMVWGKIAWYWGVVEGLLAQKDTTEA